MAEERAGTKGTVHPNKEHSIDAFGSGLLHLDWRRTVMVWVTEKSTGPLYDVSKDQ